MVGACAGLFEAKWVASGEEIKQRRIASVLICVRLDYVEFGMSCCLILRKKPLFGDDMLES